MRRIARATLILAVIVLSVLVFYPEFEGTSTEGSDRAHPPGLHDSHHFDTLV